ncbi:PIN domain-containing protein [Lysinibacillus capsici]|uniref:PIN domain-containing protein n=1 Tax=Lysinibacillus capsici TaxID=2115968 RepID=UPI0028AB4E59|nr:PIN domain-containing protein [Lysinibacillus capsici]
MKYLMLDTNIYLDMVISRNRDHKPDSHNHLLKLLNYGEICLLVPKIVITEIFRHINDEIDKIGKSIIDVKGTIDNLYWINNNEDLEKFHEKLEPVKKGLNYLNDEFNSGKEIYNDNSKELFNKLFNHENTIIIEETEDIVFKATQRKIHKLRPFHYGKDEDKDSMADSIIIETLINIEDLISFNKDDQIYFISRNPKDFSENIKENRDVLHNDILSSLVEKKINDQIFYRLFFTKTLISDFKDETENVGLIEVLEAEEQWEIQDNRAYLVDMERESVGLSSLSSDYYEMISELKGIEELIYNLEQFQKDLNLEYELYLDKDNFLREELEKRNFEELVKLVSNFNHFKPLFEIEIAGYEEKDEIIDEIYSYVHQFCFNVEEIDIDGMLKYQDYFESNVVLGEIYDFNGTYYRIETEGEVDPYNGGEDTIYLPVYRDNYKIVSGEINLYYGHVEFNDDNNVGDASEESIVVNIDNVIHEIENIKSIVLSKIVTNTKALNRLIENLGL